MRGSCGSDTQLQRNTVPGNLSGRPARPDPSDFQILLVDNGSTDGSLELARQRYPEVEVIALPENFGFCRAVNEGIRRRRRGT